MPLVPEPSDPSSPLTNGAESPSHGPDTDLDMEVFQDLLVRAAARCIWEQPRVAREVSRFVLSGTLSDFRVAELGLSAAGEQHPALEALRRIVRRKAQSHSLPSGSGHPEMAGLPCPEDIEDLAAALGNTPLPALASLLSWGGPALLHAGLGVADCGTLRGVMGHPSYPRFVAEIDPWLARVIDAALDGQGAPPSCTARSSRITAGPWRRG